MNAIRPINSWVNVYEVPRCQTDSQHVLHFTRFTGQTYSTTPIFTPYGRGYSSGKHEWVFYFNRCRGQVAVAIIPVELKLSGNLQTTPGIGNRVGWAYNQNGYFTYEVPLWESRKRYSASYSSWDMIGILLDLESGTLRFMLNGEELGIACDKGLCGHELVPAVCLCSRSEKATFISSRIFL